MSALHTELADAEATRQWGRTLAQMLQAGDLVILTGDLGAGKTTLTQGIGVGLGVRGRVASPTFIIAREHPANGSGPSLIHVDAYRLNSLAEVDALDLDSSLDQAVTVVEWGAGLVEGLAQDRLEISLERPRGASGAGAMNETRRVMVTAVGSRWADLEMNSLLDQPPRVSL